MEKKQGWITVGELEGCVHYKVGTKAHSRVCGDKCFTSLLQDDLTKNKRVLARPAVKYERIKFLVIALKSSVEIYAWAPKPYHKFMAFKVASVSLSLLPTCRNVCGAVKAVPLRSFLVPTVVH